MQLQRRQIPGKLCWLRHQWGARAMISPEPRSENQLPEPTALKSWMSKFVNFICACVDTERWLGPQYWTNPKPGKGRCPLSWITTQTWIAREELSLLVTFTPTAVKMLWPERGNLCDSAWFHSSLFVCFRAERNGRVYQLSHWEGESTQALLPVQTAASVFGSKGAVEVQSSRSDGG